MAEFKDWAPKPFFVLRHYSWGQFVADLLAGVTVGLVALPLAMAFAIASSVPPQCEEHVGKYNICGSIAEALERAREVYEGMCATLFGRTRVRPTNR
jgi:hypothetical protein